jgi:hypothetical protein
VSTQVEPTYGQPSLVPEPRDALEARRVIGVAVDHQDLAGCGLGRRV